MKPNSTPEITPKQNLTLFNSLTKSAYTFKIEEYADKKLKIYSCGPTVYDAAHIGNLASFIFADTLRRTAMAAGFDVLHVMNYTDIDDKTIRKSKEQYPDLTPNEALKKSTEHYIQLFQDDLRAVGFDVENTTFIKATDHIGDMQRMIVELLEKDIAYIADDGIYFSIDAYKNAGHTYGQLVEVSAGSDRQSRIANDEYDKDSAQDFALWKLQKPGEPSWDFVHEGKNYAGRPGWHIECSAMSRALLGAETFDIHTGGVDLKFPHHENEIAQTCGALGAEHMARVFAHNEHILIDGKKMSKSLNNFYTLKDIKDKGYSPLDFRLLVLQGHYSNQVHFSWDNLESARNRRRNINNLSSWISQAGKTELLDPISITDLRRDMTTIQSFSKHLMDNIDTPHALEYMSFLIDDVLTGTSIDTTQGLDMLHRDLNALLGLSIPDAVVMNSTVKDLLIERARARENKDFKLSDELRDKIKILGYEIVSDKNEADPFTGHPTVRQVWRKIN
jgi:cysteinyl-tRNA synthetase